MRPILPSSTIRADIRLPRIAFRASIAVVSYRHGLIPRGFALCSGLAIAVLVASATPAVGADKQANQAKERAARKACSVDGQEWPRLATGVWKLTNTVTTGSRKAKTSTLKTEACTDPSWLFSTYFGRGILERQGCQFSSWQTSSDHYRIETACRVRHVGASRTKGTVVVENPHGFRMEAELLEGTKQIQIVQTGKWIANCNH